MRNVKDRNMAEVQPTPTIMLAGWRIKNRIRPVRALPADGRPVPLADLGVGCKWPVGRNKINEHLFCNRMRSGESYCDEHDRKSAPDRFF
jgi:hypothetical protein